MPGRETWSVGAAADSAHEYLLKQYLLTGQTDVANLEMCTYTGYNHRAPTDVRLAPADLLTTNEILTQLMYVTPNREMLYVTEGNGPKHVPSHTFEHLACFFPGRLALGAHPRADAARHGPGVGPHLGVAPGGGVADDDERAGGGAHRGSDPLPLAVPHRSSSAPAHRRAAGRGRRWWGPRCRSR